MALTIREIFRQAARPLWLVVLCLLLGDGLGHAATPLPPIEPASLATEAARFQEPLVPTAATSPQEDADLAAAIARYRGAAEPDDLTALEDFLTRHPVSGWRVAVLTNLGLSYFHYGHFSKAPAAFAEAWSEGRTVQAPRARALVDRAAGELLRMQARLGHVPELTSLLAETETRGLSGPATELRDEAKETLWLIRHDPARAFRCGPLALWSLMHAEGVTGSNASILDSVRIGPQGTTLAELGDMATRAGFAHLLVHRSPGEPVPVPSVVHFRTGHFATILSERTGRYEVTDPEPGSGRLWITRAALNSEASGFFLVPRRAGTFPWREANAAEATAIRGTMPTADQNPSATTPQDTSTGGNSPPCGAGGAGGAHGMCGYTFTEMVVSLRLTDTPVGYVPPKGPPVGVTISYEQRELSQPATFSFFNISPKWTLNWLSYIQDDPTSPGTTVTRYVAGGGSVSYAGYQAPTGTFAPESRDASVLTLVSTNPATYQRKLPNGSIEIYGLPDGATVFPRRVFMTQLIDASGNAVTLQYDNSRRLSTLVDATGRSTTFAYGNVNPLLITRITDPFGRSASLTYDGSGRLIQITDVLGLTSTFSYDSSSLVDALTTPYGTTQFAYGDNGNARYLQATDPLGQTERLEWLQGIASIPGSDPPNLLPAGILNLYDYLLMNRNTIYWDKHAYSIGRGDYTKGRIKHWCEQPDGYYTSTYIDSIKNPLENRIWFNYPGQTTTLQSGTFNLPTRMGRVLDDGSTQLTQWGYNTAGNLNSIIDPLGRTTTLLYATNQIDVTTVQQATASGAATVADFSYNAQHLPLTYTDAAGQTTHYTYNAAGQIGTVTDALGETTTFNYDPLGYLLSVVNANGKTAASFTYDAYGRVATQTDSQGWTVSFLYDTLERLTQETFPDGTTRVYTYKLLDLFSVKDRQGRVTTATYDAVRNLTSVTDPAGDVTKFGYYENGVLKTLTDPDGHVTSWNIDLESRPTGKTYPDGRTFLSAYEATNSRLHAITDPLGQTKQYSYLADNRPSLIQYLNAVNPTPSVAFGYDPYFPRLTSMTDGSGTTSYAYEAAGTPGALKLALESPPFANSAIAYHYDALGRVTGRSVGGDAETLTYDAIGRVTSHASDLGTFQRFYLGETGQLTHQTSGFVGTRWAYDSNLNDRRLISIANSPAGSHFGYTTTPENDITAITESFSHQTWSYVYDNADRLKSATSSLGPLYQYGYDAASNLGPIQTPSGITSVTSNSDNQVASAGSTAFSYDANGNLLADYARTYAWDAENRLVGIGYPSKPGVFTAIRYDGLGRRIAIDEGSGNTVTGETRYGWCGEAMCQARAASDAVVKRYFAEGEADLANNLSLYYGVDQLGSVRDVIETSSGLHAAHFDYQPYGNPSSTLGSGLAWTDFRYAGLFYHPESGLYLADYRAYDATLGRWLSRDPVGEGGGVNIYEYALDAPNQNTDVTGKFAVGSVVGTFYGGLSGGFAAYAQGGTTLDIVVGTLLGGGTGFVLGALDPSEGVLTLAAIGASASFAGDVAGQAVDQIDALAHCRRPEAFDYWEAIGATVGGGIGGAAGAGAVLYARAAGPIAEEDLAPGLGYLATSQAFKDFVESNLSGLVGLLPSTLGGPLGKSIGKGFGNN